MPERWSGSPLTPDVQFLPGGRTIEGRGDAELVGARGTNTLIAKEH